MNQNRGFVAGILLVVVLGLSTACTAPATNTNVANATSPTATPAAAAATVADGDWPGYNRTLDSQRYSPLNQITPQNVASMRQICTFDLGESANFQSGIVVVNNTMYVTTEKSTFAIDPGTCQQKWKHTTDKPTPEGLRVNRGVAYAEGKIFRGINSGYLTALDANTGQFLWESKMADPNLGETIPAAPVAWNGMVFIGQADGKQLWSFDLVPMTGPGSETWPPNTDENPRTGGATWTSYTIDQSSGLLYVPVGNAAPDFDIKLRPGLNLYTNSVVILDAKTGAFREHYQLTPYDFHDWDIAATPALIRTSGGKNLIVAAGKDGIVHAIDPAQKAEIYKTPVTTIENVETPLSADKEVRFCPGTQGGVEWNGTAFNPTANLIFVNSVDVCFSIKLTPETLKGAAGSPYTGGTGPTEAFGKFDPKEKWKGWVTALNADDGTVKWKFQSPTPMLGAITATGGGLVLTGDLNGDLYAFNAADGRQLWKQNTGFPIGGGIVTYLANGKQLVGVASGMNSMLWQTKAGNAKVVVYGLP